MTHKFKIGVLAMMKNESRNIDEWLDHYFWLGVDQIYLIDNGSTDNSAEIALRHERSKDIQTILLPIQHQQYKNYQRAIRKLRVKRDCEWLMIADLDEFWFVKDGRKIFEILPEYDGIDVVYANWTIFGSSGLTKHPKSIREELTFRKPLLGPHTATKWLCRTKVFNMFATAGIHKIRGGSSTRTISDNVNLQINHYIIQSAQFFQEVKITRGDASNEAKDSIRNWQYFHDMDASCTLRETLLRDLIG